MYAYTNLNVGDDLFIHKLVSSYPDIRFVLTAQKPYKEMFSGYRNVTVYEEESFPLNFFKKHRIDDRLRWRISHECDYAVYIGGSIFKEYSEWKDQPQWYRELFDNDRLYFMGCSWSPFRTKRFEKEMRDVFSEMKDVCFRDLHSYNTFSSLPNVRYAPDILFDSSWPQFDGLEEKKQVLVSVVNCREENVGLAEYASAYNGFIGRLAEQFAGRGYNVILCSFCEKEGDLAAAEEIRNSLSPEVRKSTSVANYCGTNLEEIVRLVAQSEYVVATRFHAMILGLRAKKKVLPLIYHPKMRHVLEDLDFQGAYFDIEELPHDHSEIIDEISYGIDDSDRVRLARLAAGHFDLLNEILK